MFRFRLARARLLSACCLLTVHCMCFPAFVDALAEGGDSTEMPGSDTAPSAKPATPEVLRAHGVGEAGSPVPVFATSRRAWYPDTLLGRLGMDVGLLDEVEDRKRLTGSDRECFYQMLAAVERARPGQLSREARRRLEQAEPRRKRTGPGGDEHFSVEPLFNDPVSQRGRLVELSGTARRVVRIRVDDSDIKGRLGIDHYYSVFLFTDDSQSNPVVFCVRNLPPGMSPGTGPRYASRVRIAGFFMKTWAYRVRRPENAPRARRGRLQLAPLLIGRGVTWYPEQPPATNTAAQAIAGGLFLLVLVAVWVALWRYARGDKRFREQTMARFRPEPPGTSLDEINQNASGEEFP